MFVQHFFLGTKYYGSAPRGKQYLHGELVSPEGLAMWCPYCAEVWFKAPIEGQYTRVLTSPCEKHGLFDRGIISCLDTPGSIFKEFFDADFVQVIPKALWLRELELEMQIWERY